MKDYYCERMKSKCLLYKQLVEKAKGRKKKIRLIISYSKCFNNYMKYRGYTDRIKINSNGKCKMIIDNKIIKCGKLI